MALLLRDVVGLSYNEIADSLEVTLATVKWRIFKAREDVQVALAREGITFGADAPGSKPAHSSRTPRASAAGSALRARRSQRSLDPVREPGGEHCGQPASRISACVSATGYVTRRNDGPTRGLVDQQPGGTWVAVTGLADRAGVQQPAAGPELELGPLGRQAPRRAPPRPSRSPSATWLWPTSTSGAVVSRMLISATCSLST